MKMSLPVVSLSLAFILFGCSMNHHGTNSASSSAQSQVAASTAGSSNSSQTATPLPRPSAGQLSLQPWRPQPVNDHLGGAIALKRTSVDGKYDLVILEKGSVPFLSITRQGKWEAVHDLPAKGKLIDLRLEFEDGKEKHVEWDELGYGTENLCAVLWSYPVKADSVGGDQLLTQEMMIHKAMILEIEPGVTAQFDLTGFANEMKKIRPNRPEQVLEARQGAE